MNLEKRINDIEKDAIEQNTDDKYTKDISDNIKKICDMLSVESKEFDMEKTIKVIEDYVNKYERWMYSDVSNNIFGEKETKVNSMISNISKLVSYVCSEYYNEKISKIQVETQRNNKELIRNKILKLHDHINLAYFQYVNFNKTEEQNRRDFDNNISSYKEQMTREFSTQLISLLGIFTAMAFLVFGGINSLDNILSGAVNVPITELVIIGCIWGLCIINLIFVFMFFIAKLTNLNIKSDVDVNAGIVKKYPLICWINLVLMTILLFCSWIYYIDWMDIGQPVNQLIRDYSLLVLPLITGIIIACFVILSILILNRDRKKKKK